MARRVIWAPRSRYDLHLAREYISRDTPEGARKFVQAVIHAGRSLAEFSERGRVVPELGEPGVREVFVSRYRVIYEIFYSAPGDALSPKNSRSGKRLLSTQRR